MIQWANSRNFSGAKRWWINGKNTIVLEFLCSWKQMWLVEILRYIKSLAWKSSSFSSEAWLTHQKMKKDALSFWMSRSAQSQQAGWQCLLHGRERPPCLHSMQQDLDSMYSTVQVSCSWNWSCAIQSSCTGKSHHRAALEKEGGKAKGRQCCQNTASLLLPSERSKHGTTGTGIAQGWGATWQICSRIN